MARYQIKKAPSQNRTDTRSLEGYCSTIELQARVKWLTGRIFTHLFYFFNGKC